MITIKLGFTQEQVIGVLGTPLQESSESGMKVLWYTYHAPTLADFYFFKDGKLEEISKSYYQNHQFFGDYLAKYGNPALSIRRLAPGEEDSLQETVHIWPAAGRAVTTIGFDRNSNVIREDQFSPTTLQNYFATWGKEYANNEHVTISNQLMQEIASQPVVIAVLGTGVVGSIILIVVLGIWLKKKLTSKG